MTVQITRAAADAVIAHAGACHPEEACGLLLGAPGRIEGVRRAANLSPAPRTAFEIDPQALFEVQRAARHGGPALVGYYHSHPEGSAQPSRTDARHALPDGRIWLIAARGTLAAFRAGDTGIFARFEPVRLAIF